MGFPPTVDPRCGGLGVKPQKLTDILKRSGLILQYSVMLEIVPRIVGGGLSGLIF